LLVVAVTALGTAHALPASAQTSSNGVPATAQSFLTSVGQYFTGFNSNYTMLAAHHIEAWTAAEYSQGENWADDLGIDYRFDSGIRLETVFQNAGINGTILSAQCGVGYSIVYIDTEFAAGLNVGYRPQQRWEEVTPYLEARKSLTANTWAGLRLSYEIDTGPGAQNGARTPSVAVEMGVKF
jgi:hypothetical protein